MSTFITHFILVSISTLFNHIYIIQPTKDKSVLNCTEFQDSNSACPYDNRHSNRFFGQRRERCILGFFVEHTFLINFVRRIKLAIQCPASLGFGVYSQFLGVWPCMLRSFKHQCFERTLDFPLCAISCVASCRISQA